ncbi:envelope integrity protein Cei [Williamsia deligens]|uniref:Envelope integrity protein Cei n=1 Tax=Williamsia deligens TaxID=321325 RepID=A0ABW3GDR4_9NOCA|nr:envelope integrity protein Cei [Williamsia deligens]MCP2195397.1 LytR cell envelope-related transcriptional attenuator [Williamsia deligens]
MVSQITLGYPTDDHGRPFRRRRWIPFVVTAVVLLVLGLIVWVSALSKGSSDAVASTCNPPTTASTAPSASGAPASAAPRTTVQASQMTDVPPAALASFQVRVLNASAKRGEARSVLDDLTGQGFTPATDTPYADDTLYADQNLDCVGQIRFGPGSRAAAAAVWVAVPCAELVDDGRSGTVVDLALGRQFTSREQSQDAQAVLESLRSTEAGGRTGGAATGADQSLVRAVHNGAC